MEDDKKRYPMTEQERMQDCGELGMGFEQSVKESSWFIHKNIVNMKWNSSLYTFSIKSST